MRIQLLDVRRCFVLTCVLAAANCIAQNKTAQIPVAKQPAITREATNVHLAVDDPRPLAKALDSLQQQYGWQTDYEDPPYITAADVSDVPDFDSRTAGGKGRIKIPGGHAFTVDFPAGKAAEDVPDEEKTVQLIVDSYNRSGNPGQFELRKADNYFEVIGVAARDERGTLAKQPIAFDLPITLAEQSRSAEDTVDLICQALSEHTAFKINLGVFPTGLMGHTNVTVGGKDLPARVLLRKTLAATGRQLVWRLLFDPDSKTYMLNLHLLKHT